MNDAPQEYKIAGICMIVAGLMNAMLSFIWFITLIWVLVGVFWIVPGLIGLAEVAVGAMMLANRPSPQSKVVSGLGIFAGFMNCGSIFSIILEVVAIVMTSNPAVKEWMEEY